MQRKLICIDRKVPFCNTDNTFGQTKPLISVCLKHWLFHIQTTAAATERLLIGARFQRELPQPTTADSVSRHLTLLGLPQLNDRPTCRSPMIIGANHVSPQRCRHRLVNVSIPAALHEMTDNSNPILRMRCERYVNCLILKMAVVLPRVKVWQVFCFFSSELGLNKNLSSFCRKG